MNGFLRMLRSRAFWNGFFDGYKLAGLCLAPALLVLQIVVLYQMVAGCR